MVSFIPPGSGTCDIFKLSGISFISSWAATFGAVGVRDGVIVNSSSAVEAQTPNVKRVMTNKSPNSSSTLLSVLTFSDIRHYFFSFLLGLLKRKKKTQGLFLPKALVNLNMLPLFEG